MPQKETKRDFAWAAVPLFIIFSAISPDVEEVEFEGEIEEINTNNYVIDGKTVWITSDTVLKINDEDPLEIGSPAQVKVMHNPDGEVVGIKVELN